MSHPAVTERDIETYERDGVACIRNAFSKDWLDLLAQGVEKDIAAPGPLHTIQQTEGDAGFFLTDFCMSHRLPEFRKFICESPAGGIAAALMRSKRTNFFYDAIWVKGTGTPKRTRWHQDQPYYSVDGQHMCIFWLPLDPVAKDVSLELIRGSHKWGRWFQPELTRSGKDLYPDTDAFERMPDIQAERAKYDIVSFDMQPGDIIAFHGMVVHGAPGNPNQQHRRRALSTIWLGDDAVYAERPGPVRPLFQGHGLKPGDAMDCAYFPRVWPGTAPARLADGPRFADNSSFTVSI